MIGPYAVAGFLAAVFPITATPGASVALLIQGGRRRALPVILGTITGLYVHATLAVLGLSAIVMQSSEAFAVVRVVGAVYLVGLGLWTWFSTGSASRVPLSGKHVTASWLPESGTRGVSETGIRGAGGRDSPG